MPKQTDEVMHDSCLVTGAIRIYYWYKNAELLTDANDPNVNKWRTSFVQSLTLNPCWIVSTKKI